MNYNSKSAQNPSLHDTNSVAFNWKDSTRFLSMAIVAKFVVSAAVYATGFYALGGDDFGKLRVAEAWANAPSFAPNRIWLPLEFYVTGSVSLLTGNVYVASIIVNTFWSVGSCVIIFLLTDYIFGNRNARLAVVLLVCCPWHTWTTISGQGEAMYYFLFLAIIFTSIRWLSETNSKWLITTAVIMVLLTAARHQGWILVMLVTLYLVAFSFYSKNRRLRRWELAILVLSPCVFPLAWFAFSALEYGDPLHVLRVGESDRGKLLSFSTWLAGARVPIYFFLVSPLLFPFVILGVWSLKSLNRPETVFYGFICCSYTGMIFLFFVMGAQSLYVEQRYVLPILFACIPLAASAINGLRVSRGVRLFIVVTLCLWGLCSTFRANREYLAEASVGRYLNGLWQEGTLGPASTVFIHPRDQNRREYRFDISAVGIWSQHSENVIGTKQYEEFETAMAKSNNVALSFLAKNEIEVVFTDSAVEIERLHNVWHYAGCLFGYKVFFDPHRLPADNDFVDNDPSHEVNRRWTNGFKLQGVTYCYPNFPNLMVARWRFPRTEALACTAVWKFTPIRNGVEPFTISARIGNGLQWEQLSNRTASDRFIIGLKPTEEGDRRVGLYALSVRLFDTAGKIILLEDHEGKQKDACAIGTVNVINSKKRVLNSFIKGNCPDPPLAYQVIWSLIN